ncbi:MAG: hypothetical protein DRP08_08015 [Candidatus Aenigmatarchaeota archaeon]|nr:MAG: hypothetical protein DRP08_08015 [Candidatus Aenigmarchaeota archaeon]
MAESCRTLCKPVVELKTKIESIEKDIQELQLDRRAQDVIIKHGDTILNEVRAQSQMLITQFDNFGKQFNELKEKTRGFSVMKEQIGMLRKDFNDHVDEHKGSQKKASDRNWALWILLIGTIVSSVSALIINLVKG